MALGALRQRLLGLLAPARHRLQARLDLRPRGPCRLRAFLGVYELRPPGPHSLARELEARLQHLVLQALVQLRRLGLALERAQPCARLTLHVERAVEVLLRALQLQLRAATALAVLAKTRRLLDQEAPVAGL